MVYRNKKGSESPRIGKRVVEELGGDIEKLGSYITDILYLELVPQWVKKRVKREIKINPFWRDALKATSSLSIIALNPDDGIYAALYLMADFTQSLVTCATWEDLKNLRYDKERAPSTLLVELFSQPVRYVDSLYRRAKSHKRTPENYNQ